MSKLTLAWIMLFVSVIAISAGFIIIKRSFDDAECGHKTRKTLFVGVLMGMIVTSPIWLAVVYITQTIAEAIPF